MGDGGHGHWISEPLRMNVYLKMSLLFKTEVLHTEDEFIDRQV